MDSVKAMNVTIEDGNDFAVISTLGSELLSFSSEGKNVLYNGRACSGSSYIQNALFLFPVCGRLIDNSYIYEGKKYQLNIHGFAKKSLFEIGEKTRDTVVLFLSNKENTMKHFPFHFNLSITYQIKNAQLNIKVEIVNKDKTNNLYFSYGFHPAFATTGSYIGKRLSFDNDYNVKRLIVNKKGFFTEEIDEFIPKDKGITFTGDSFKKTTLLYTDYKIQKAKLELEEYDILIDLKDYPTLALWSNNKSFLCVEPWNGLCDCDGSVGDIEDKRGIIKLLPFKCHCSSFSIKIVHK